MTEPRDVTGMLADFERTAAAVFTTGLDLAGDEALDRLYADMGRVLEGAEERGEEWSQLTPGQAWGLLLVMPPEKRLLWLRSLLEHARAGSDCFLMDHRTQLDELDRRRREDVETAYRIAEQMLNPPMRVVRLPDPPEENDRHG